jgi:hypothetical protein
MNREADLFAARSEKTFSWVSDRGRGKINYESGHTAPPRERESRLEDSSPTRRLLNRRVSRLSALQLSVYLPEGIFSVCHHTRRDRLDRERGGAGTDLARPGGGPAPCAAHAGPTRARARTGAPRALMPRPSGSKRRTDSAAKSARAGTSPRTSGVARPPPEGPPRRAATAARTAARTRTRGARATRGRPPRRATRRETRGVT